MGTTEWQPIGTAPKDGRCILVWWFEFQQCRIVFWSADRGKRGPGWVEDFTAGVIEHHAIPDPPGTYWMDLPDPPQGEVA